MRPRGKHGFPRRMPKGGTRTHTPFRAPDGVRRVRQFRHFGLSTQDRSPTTRATATSVVAERAEKADTSRLHREGIEHKGEEGLLRKKLLWRSFRSPPQPLGCRSRVRHPARPAQLRPASCRRRPVVRSSTRCSGSPRYSIASDLPLGAGRAQPLSMVKAIQYVIEKQFNFRPHVHRRLPVVRRRYGSAGWLGDRGEVHRERACVRANDSGACSPCWGRSTRGCAKLEILISTVRRAARWRDVTGNTAVGLTGEAPERPGREPRIYYLIGSAHHAARVASIVDAFQGPFAADLLKRIKKRSVYILHDNQTSGKGVANAFRRGPTSSTST